MLARVIVLNWNGKQWLTPCLTALLGQGLPDVEVVLVDNGSTDGSAELVQARYPTVSVRALGRNIGFAAGNNAGALGAEARYLVFLNNDTRVQPGWLQALVAAAEADATVGLATSKIVYADGSGLVDSAGDGYLRCGGAFKIWHGQPAATAPMGGDVFGACGAAFLIRRDLFEALGGFDEDFFVVYEDVDLSFRAQLLGARCRYVPDAVVEHAVTATLGRVSETVVFHGQRNLEWAWIKNMPASLWWRSLLPHVAYDLAGAAAYARRGQLGVWLRGKAAALKGLPRMWRKRRHIQRTASTSVSRLWALMEPDWIGIKRREKRFDFTSGS